MRSIALTLTLAAALAAAPATATAQEPTPFPLPEIEITPQGGLTARASTFTGANWVPGRAMYVHLRLRGGKKFVRTQRILRAVPEGGAWTARARPFRKLGNRGTRWVAQFDQQAKPSRTTRPAVVHSIILREAAPAVGLRERYITTTRGRLRA